MTKLNFNHHFSFGINYKCMETFNQNFYEQFSSANRGKELNPPNTLDAPLRDKK
jgi:hypothetical protein